MATKERFVEIDLLRGFAMVAMILIHTNAYFLSVSPFIENLWDWSQFAVPVFIMCSAFLFFIKTPAFSFAYIKKRFFRLLVPYYIFMLFFWGAILLRDPHKLNFNFIQQSVLLTGGIDINWLVLLFLEFTFVMPLVAFLWHTFRLGFWGYFALSTLCSLVFVVYKWPYDYKLIMWLPYSLLIIYTLLLAVYRTRKWFYPVSLIVSGGVFLALRLYETQIHHSLTFYDNKYPPTLYFLSFGVFSIALLHFLVVRGLFSFAPVKKLLNFLSFYSYEIYFIHYVLLYLISWTFNWIQFNWITFFIAVFTSSWLTQLAFVYIKIFLRRVWGKIFTAQSSNRQRVEGSTS